MTEEVKNRVANALYEILRGQEAMHCTRVWEAWQYGTMTEDDFDLVVNDTPALEEIVDAVMTALEGGF